MEKTVTLSEIGPGSLFDYICKLWGLSGRTKSFTAQFSLFSSEESKPVFNGPVSFSEEGFKFVQREFNDSVRATVCRVTVRPLSSRQGRAVKMKGETLELTVTKELAFMPE